MSLDLLGAFDDYGAKFKNMVILTTVIAFINYCVDNGLQPTVEKVIVYSFPYILINAVMKVIKELQPRIVSQKFDNTCVFEFSIRESKAELLQDKLNKLSFE